MKSLLGCGFEDFYLHNFFYSKKITKCFLVSDLYSNEFFYKNCDIFFLFKKIFKPKLVKFTLENQIPNFWGQKTISLVPMGKMAIAKDC